MTAKAMKQPNIRFEGDEVLDTLDQAVVRLESVADPQFQEELCEMQAEELARLHLSLGMWIRNFILLTAPGSRLLLVGKTSRESTSSHIILAFWQRLRARRWSRSSSHLAGKLPSIVVLGLGEHGTRFVSNFLQRDQDDAVASDTLFLARIHSVQALNWPFAPPPEDRHALEEAFLNAKEVLIVGTAGGTLCRLLIGSFLSLARSKGITPTALVSLPADWEGGVRCRRAQESVSDLVLSGFNVVTVHESCLRNIEAMSQEQVYDEIGKQVGKKIGGWLKVARSRGYAS